MLTNSDIATQFMLIYVFYSILTLKKATQQMMREIIFIMRVKRGEIMLKCVSHAQHEHVRETW